MLEPTSSSELSLLNLALLNSCCLTSVDEIKLDLGDDTDDPVLILNFLNFSKVFTDLDPSFVELFW